MQDATLSETKPWAAGAGGGGVRGGVRVEGGCRIGTLGIALLESNRSDDFSHTSIKFRASKLRKHT